MGPLLKSALVFLSIVGVVLFIVKKISKISEDEIDQSVEISTSHCRPTKNVDSNEVQPLEQIFPFLETIVDNQFAMNEKMNEMSIQQNSFQQKLKRLDKKLQLLSEESQFSGISSSQPSSPLFQLPALLPPRQFQSLSVSLSPISPLSPSVFSRRQGSSPRRLSSLLEEVKTIEIPNRKTSLDSGDCHPQLVSTASPSNIELFHRERNDKVPMTSPMSHHPVSTSINRSIRSASKPLESLFQAPFSDPMHGEIREKQKILEIEESSASVCLPHYNDNHENFCHLPPDNKKDSIDQSLLSREKKKLPIDLSNVPSSISKIKSPTHQFEAPIIDRRKITKNPVKCKKTTENPGIAWRKAPWIS